MKKIKTLLCRWFPRYKLRCILRTLRLDVRPWQIEFALCRSNYMPAGRCTGKTVAIMLRALMTDPKLTQDLNDIMWADPDYRYNDRKRVLFYRREYDLYCSRCLQAGIPVPLTLFSVRGNNTAVWVVKEGRP